MDSAAEIEFGLYTALPANLHTYVPSLAKVLVDTIEVDKRFEQIYKLQLDPILVPLVRALSGRRLAVGGGWLIFETEDLPSDATVEDNRDYAIAKLNYTPATNEDGASAHVHPSLEPLLSGDISAGDISGKGIAIGHGAQVTLIEGEHAFDVRGLPNPYLGLRAFTYAERTIYAGRATDIGEAVTKLTRPSEQRTLLFVTGTSGSGKSSFVQAVLPPQN